MIIWSQRGDPMDRPDEKKLVREKDPAPAPPEKDPKIEAELAAKREKIRLSFVPGDKKILESLKTWPGKGKGENGEIAIIPVDGRLIAYSPQKSLLAVAAFPPLSPVRIYDLSAQKEILALQVSISHVADLDFSPDGSLLAIFGNSGFPTVEIWDVKEGKKTNGRGGLGAVFAPNGQLAIPMMTRKLVFFDPKSKQETQVFQAPPWSPNSEWHFSVRLMPNVAARGRFVASVIESDASYKVIVWESTTERKFRELPVPFARAITLTPDGWTLGMVQPSKDLNKLVLWDLEKNKQDTIFETDDTHDVLAQHSLAISPDGKVLAYNDSHQLLLLDFPTGKVRHRIEGKVGKQVFSSGGRILAAPLPLGIGFWDVSDLLKKH